MTQMYQVYEEDLVELERILPQLCEALGGAAPRHRTQLRRVKAILSNIRWNYGPPESIERIEPNGCDPDGPYPNEE